jgi:serine/threonine-protein kinase
VSGYDGIGTELVLRVSQLAALAMLAVIPHVAAAQELFGAIAYSDKAYKYGWANNYPTRDGATKAALELCAKNGPDCRVVLWFRNACGALVTGPDGHGAAWAENRKRAVSKATKLCAERSEACALTRSFCTGK